MDRLKHALASVQHTLAAALAVVAMALPAQAQPPPPALTGPVNDFANVIDGASKRALEEMILSLERASGDAIVVATVDTYKPDYADLKEYAVKMFENRGRGIGQKGKDNGLLVVVAVRDREVRIEVGYELEQFVTDGFAGQVSRLDMVPAFRQGQYGEGLVAGVSRLVDRIAEGRGVQLSDRPGPRNQRAQYRGRRRAAVGALRAFHRAERPGPARPASITLLGRRAMEHVAQRRGPVRRPTRGRVRRIRRWRVRRGLWRLRRRPQRRWRRRSQLVECSARCGDMVKRGMTMTRMRAAFLTIVVVGAGVATSGCSYNTFVGQEEAIKTQWAQVENQLQRRNDLIPNLVETTKGIAQQEQDVFGRIAESRAKMAGATTPEQRIAAANEQSSALARLLVVVENYPQLRSSESFNRLMDELSGTENRISVERMRYNERVQEYNTLRRRFPVERHRQHLRLQGTSAVRRAHRRRAGAEGQLRQAAQR